MNMMEFLKGYSPTMLTKLEQQYALQGNFFKARLVGDFRDTYGKRVKVVRGRKVPLGTVGECFWMGATNYKKYLDYWGIGVVVRIGIRDDAGAVHWTALDNVEVLPESEQPPKRKTDPAKYRSKHRQYEVKYYELFGREETPDLKLAREAVEEAAREFDAAWLKDDEKHAILHALKDDEEDTTQAEAECVEAYDQYCDAYDKLERLKKEYREVWLRDILHHHSKAESRQTE